MNRKIGQAALMRVNPEKVGSRFDVSDPFTPLASSGEDKAGDKGEASELDPGKSGTLTVDLKAGKYLLICNVPGHYGAGMWAEFIVEP